MTSQDQPTRPTSSGSRTVRDDRHVAPGDRVRVVVVLVLAAAQVLSAALAPWLLDADIGAVSDRYAHVLTPAGYTFAVWGLIYTASLALGVFQAMPSQHAREVHRRSGWWLAVAFAASAGWVPLFAIEQLLAAQVVLIGLVVALAGATVGLTTSSEALRSGGADRWLLGLPVTGYLGWATIATVAGTGTTALWLGVTVGPESVVAAAALVAVGIVAVLVTLRIAAAAGFAALVVWGLAGIAVGTPSAVVAGVSTAVALALLATAGVRVRRSADPAVVLLG
jgi:hypothetical protein